MCKEKRIELITIDLSNVKTKKDLQCELKDGLKIPEFYGMNWDAFWDSISGLVAMPMELKLLGWDNIEKSLPSDALIFKEIINRYNEEFSGTSCIVKYS